MVEQSIDLPIGEVRAAPADGDALLFVVTGGDVDDQLRAERTTRVVAVTETVTAHTRGCSV